jgi:superfamily I DNA/RNA helicase
MITGIQDDDEIYQAYLDMIFEKVDLPSELQFTRDFRDYGENVGKRMEDDYPGVVLCTIHSFKGKETDISYISLSKLSKPAAIKKNTIEESRRLIYVAITRARDKAVITGVYKAFGKKKEVTYNVFLKEIFEILGKVFAPPTQDDDLDAALAAYAAGVAGQTSFIGMVS